VGARGGEMRARFVALRGNWLRLRTVVAGAFDLLERGAAPGTRQRQAGSLALHAVAIAALLLLSGRLPKRRQQSRQDSERIGTSALFLETPPRIEDEGPGRGGRIRKPQGPAYPPSAGDPARHSPLVLLPPRLPDQEEHVLPIEPTVFWTRRAEESERASGYRG